MKTLAFGMWVAASGVVLSACAGGSGVARVDASAHEFDQGKMIAVDQWARRVGAKVVWINPPQRRPGGTEGG